MSAPLLSVLMPCLAHRAWQVSLDRLRHLSDGHPVEVLHDVDSGEVTSGVKRQRLMNRAQGEYLACVDDDDYLRDDYIETLIEGCREGVDVVTIELMMKRRGYRSGNELWRFGLHSQDRKRGQMTANHLCAWRAEIARRVAWCSDLGYADDQLWYQPLFAAGIAKTEHHVDHPTYEYRFCPQATSQLTKTRVQLARGYVGTGLQCWKRGEAILVECGGEMALDDDPFSERVAVRDRDNVVTCPMLRELGEPYHVVRIT